MQIVPKPEIQTLLVNPTAVYNSICTEQYYYAKQSKRAQIYQAKAKLSVQIFFTPCFFCISTVISDKASRFSSESLITILIWTRPGADSRIHQKRLWKWIPQTKFSFIFLFFGSFATWSSFYVLNTLHCSTYSKLPFFSQKAGPCKWQPGEQMPCKIYYHKPQQRIQQK